MPSPDAGDRVTWVGHATVLVALDGVRVLTDPFVRRRFMHLRRFVPDPDPATLQDLDAVLVSHLHMDHLDLPSLRRVDRGATAIVPRGAGALMRRAGFGRIVEVAVGDSVSVGSLEVIAVRAEHDRHRLPRGPVAEPLGFVVAGTRRVYFAGDTELFPEMAGLVQPPPDVGLLPVWGWGPSLGPGHMDPAQAAEAAALLTPAIAVPIHWGTYFPQGVLRRRRMALVDAPRIFAEEVARLAPATEVRILRPGETLALAPCGAAR